jgi:phosphoribosylformylglycinamidine synthase subunit PurQ / glutaminase
VSSFAYLGIHSIPVLYKSGRGIFLRFGVIVFPGSNCDHDAYHAVKHVFGQDANFIWHKDGSVGDVDFIIVPGGFSYGDYLRSGAIARFSPVMRDVVRFADKGGLVMGICNGFQVLCESHLLPGALMRNESLRFACRDVHIRVENVDSPFTGNLAPGDILSMPVAHGEGNYTADDETLNRLEGEGRVAFRYCDGDGQMSERSNPNGSTRNIAGILNKNGNVLGMMPHPERCTEQILGRADGARLFESILACSEMAL